jgi:hypothetical protein
MLIDGMQSGYDGGRPGPLDSKPEPGHPEIFPGTSARQSEDAFGGSVSPETGPPIPWTSYTRCRDIESCSGNRSNFCGSCR